MNKERPVIEISIHEKDGLHVVRISGITSGMVLHGGDGDNMSIVFGFDASRFDCPIIKKGKT